MYLDLNETASAESLDYTLPGFENRTLLYDKRNAPKITDKDVIEWRKKIGDHG